MKILIILNDAPYGNERSYNGLRLAGALAKPADNEMRVFLLGDAASCAKHGQHVPEGFYNIQLMLNKVTHSAHETIGVCGTCMEARGITDAELIEGIHRSSMVELADWTVWADKVLVF
jgi:uncharacterized protein involved in oxidation of intracellular sulfur